MSMSVIDDRAAVVAVESAAGELRREFFDDEFGVVRKLLTGWLFRLPVSRRFDSS